MCPDHFSRPVPLPDVSDRPVQGFLTGFVLRDWGRDETLFGYQLAPACQLRLVQFTHVEAAAYGAPRLDVIPAVVETILSGQCSHFGKCTSSQW